MSRLFEIKIDKKFICKNYLKLKLKLLFSCWNCLKSKLSVQKKILVFEIEIDIENHPSPGSNGHKNI